MWKLSRDSSLQDINQIHLIVSPPASNQTCLHRRNSESFSARSNTALQCFRSPSYSTLMVFVLVSRIKRGFSRRQRLKSLDPRDLSNKIGEIPSLKLTANAPENRPRPQNERIVSLLHPFSGAKMLVLGSVTYIQVPCILIASDVSSLSLHDSCCPRWSLDGADASNVWWPEISQRRCLDALIPWAAWHI